jgi:hypothetical protein
MKTSFTIFMGIVVVILVAVLVDQPILVAALVDQPVLVAALQDQPIERQGWNLVDEHYNQQVSLYMYMFAAWSQCVFIDSDSD